MEVSCKYIPITEIEQSIHTTYQQKFEYHSSYFFFNNFQCFGYCMLAWLLYVFNRRLIRDFGPQVFSHESDPPRPSSIIFGPFQIFGKICNADHWCQRHWWYFIVGVIAISDKLPQVLSKLVIKPCSILLIPWQWQLLHRRWQWHQQSLIAGNNDTSDNQLPVRKTLWIIYCRGQRHRQWNICNTSKWILSKNIIICVKKATQQNIKNFLSQIFFHLSPVSLTSLINLYLRLSPQIFIKRPPLYA